MYKFIFNYTQRAESRKHVNPKVLNLYANRFHFELAIVYTLYYSFHLPHNTQKNMK